MSNRKARRGAIARERAALKSGNWGPWETKLSPKEEGLGDGWFREMDRVWVNDVFCVMARTVETAEIGSVDHVAIRNTSGTEIAWRHKQRIKNELFGDDRVALEIYPPSDDLVDSANMYHLWILPTDVRLPFTLKEDRDADELALEGT